MKPMKPRRVVRVEDHPDFPFAPAARERRRAWFEAFVDRPVERGFQAASLHVFLEVVHRFAFLERLVQGDITFELPVLEELTRDPSWRPGPTQGEMLAHAELGALELGDIPAAELRPTLEERGIKIIGQSRPREGEPTAATGDLVGGFFFQGELGPALLVGAPEGAEAHFILAHELTHLVADFDPYRSRFCRWERGTLVNRSTSEEEQRADRFARAILMPTDSLRRYLPAILEEARRRERGYALGVISTLYETPRAVARARLVDLDLIDASAASDRTMGADLVPDPIAATPASRDFAPQVEGEFDLPQRFTNLALACFAHGVLDELWLGRFLGLGLDETRELIAETGLEAERLAKARAKSESESEGEEDPDERRPPLNGMTPD